MQIKHKHIFVPGRRYQDSRHILQDSKVSKNVLGFNNNAQRSTPHYYLDVDNPFRERVKFTGNSEKEPNWLSISGSFSELIANLAFFLNF